MWKPGNIQTWEIHSTIYAYDSVSRFSKNKAMQTKQKPTRYMNQCDIIFKDKK